MRIRSIKPAFWKSLSIAALPVQTRLHFIGLWNYADDEGRGIDDGRLLRAELWPLDEKIGVTKVGQMQADLAAAGRIVRYTDGVRNYFEVINWSEHQKIDRPLPSAYPGPDDPRVHPLDSPRAHRLFGDDAATGPRGLDDGSSLDRKGRDRNGIARKRDEVFDALVETQGSDPKALTKREATKVGVALAEIRNATPDVTPDEVRKRAENYRQRFPGSYTANALAAHWSQCDSNGQASGGAWDREAQ